MLLRITILFFGILTFYGWKKNSTAEADIPNEIVAEKQSNPFVKNWIDECAVDVGELLKQHHIPGAAMAIVYEGEVYIRTFGVRSVETREPVDAHSVFRMASLSKSFAGVLTAKLVKENKVGWNDYVSDYLPAFQLSDPAQTKRIQLKHLLSHTTGLPYHTYTNLVEANLPIGDIVTKLETVPLVGTEGTVYSYQNAPFSIIAPLLKQSTGEDYGTLLKNKIFTPTGMYDSSTDYFSITHHNNVALPHKSKKGGWYVTDISKKYYNAVPAGGVNASIHDMATYMRLLLGYYPAVLTESDLDVVFAPFVQTPIKRRYFSEWPKLRSANYGMGWRILDYGGQTIAYHSGFVNSYKGELAIDRNEKIGFCLLMNAPGKCSKKMVPVFLDSYHKHKTEIKTWTGNDLDRF